MGAANITINVPSRPSSVSRDRPDEHDSPEEELAKSGQPDSPTYSVRSAARAAASRSGSSSHHGDVHERDYVKVHLHYPDEGQDGEHLDRQDQLSRIQSSDRGGTRHTSRSDPLRRTYSDQIPPRDGLRSRPQEPAPHSPTESGDSTEDFLHRPGPRPMARPQSYYENYPHSGSSGSAYATHPQQIVPHQHTQAHPYQQYPPMQGPPPVPYPPPSHMGYSHYAPHPGHPGSHVSSPYAPSPYGPQSMAPSQYGPPSYFPPQPHLPYGQPYPPSQQYPHQYIQYPPHVPMQMPHYVDPLGAYRVQSPSHTSPAPVSESAKDNYNQEELLKRIDALMKEKPKEKKDTDLISKDEALRQAMEQVKADVKAAAAAADAQSKEESRIREEAKQDAIRAVEAERRRAAEQAEREQKIRKEAAEAALKAAEAEAAAKAERAAVEKRIAETAAEQAKTAAEKEFAEAAAKKETEAKKAQEEAELKLKQAEEAAAKAKADAEAAEKKVAENTPPEKKAPVRFKDALGRNYNFPFERCHKWRDMEGLINQAFAHVDHLADWVHGGNYDLLGPDGEIIMPQYWRETILPDMQITMMLWQMPEKNDKDGDPPPPLEGDILNLDDILNPSTGEGKKKSSKKKKEPKPGGLASWMLGGAPGKRHLKGDKKPDVAAGNASQRGAADEPGSCTVM